MKLGLSPVIAWLKLRLRASGNSPSARCFLLLQDVLTAERSLSLSPSLFGSHILSLHLRLPLLLICS